MNIKKLTTIGVLCLIMLPAPKAVLSQEAKHPVVGDTELYVVALQLVKNMEDQAVRESDPEVKRNIHLAIINDTKLSEADFAIVLSISRQVPSLLVQSDGKRLSTSSRSNMINTTVQYLSTHLSSTGWQNFNAFVNGPVRNTTVILTNARGGR